MTAAGNESLCLAAAKAYQRETDWHRRRPSIPGLSEALDRRRFLALSALAAGSLYRRLEALPLVPRPLEKRGPAQKVLVLGAGLAGLSAAHELSAAGHDPTILEAQARPGGRVLTLREPFSDGLYAEAGAGRIPDTHELTLHYVKLFGLTLDPFYPTKLSQIAFLRGKRIRFDRLSRIDMAQVSLDLTPEERAAGLDGIEERYVRSAFRELGDFAAEDWPQEGLRTKYDGLTFAEFLRVQGASKDAITFLSQGFEDDAALDFLRDAVSHNAGKLYKIHGGNDQLPRAFAARLSERIRYGAVVTEIRQDDGGVEVAYEQAGAPQKARGDRVVCALPFAVLRCLTILPPFAADKREAVERLRYGNVTRVILQTRRRFWTDEGLNGFALVDRPMEVWSPSFDQPGRRGLLTAYTYEALARETGAMTEAARIRWTAGYLSNVHPGLHQYLEGGVSKCWDEDPFARGAYTLFNPGELGRLPPILQRSEGRIHFAGEHVSPYPGWMQGALMSGLRAAREVNEARG